MSMFKAAKTLEGKTTAAKKQKEGVHIDDLLQLAEIDALIKALGGMKETLEASVKSSGFEHLYVNAGGKRPENLRGVDGIASASIEMRKRSTASALSEDEQSMLTKYNLPMDKVVAAPKMFGINPVYTSSDELLEKVSAALEGIVPEDFIVLQEEKSKTVVTDATLDEAFKTGAPREVIQAITVMAVKPKLDSTDLAGIIESVKLMIADPETN